MMLTFRVVFLKIYVKKELIKIRILTRASCETTGPWWLPEIKSLTQFHEHFYCSPCRGHKSPWVHDTCSFVILVYNQHLLSCLYSGPQATLDQILWHIHVYSQYLAWAWHRLGTQDKFSNKQRDALLVSLSGLRSEGQGSCLILCCLHITSYLIHECSVNAYGLNNEALCEARMETSSVCTHSHTNTHTTVEVHSLVEAMEARR